MNKNLLQTAAALGGLSVVLGAFAAHGLKSKVAPEQLLVFETGVRYMFYHAIAILFCGLLSEKFNTVLPGKLFVTGIIMFSGSLFLLSTRELTGLNSWSWLGPVTPVGGLFFIAGWLTLFVNFRKTKNL